MISEPAIGVTHNPLGTFSALRGFLYAVAFGVTATVVTLSIPLICGTLRLWFAADSSQSGWRPLPLELYVPWATIAAYSGWVCALAGFLQYAPAQRPGFVRAFRTAGVACLAAMLVVAIVLPEGSPLAEDPDIRIRIAALLGLSITIAWCNRNSTTWTI